MNKTVLITGGAGYIGSSAAYLLYKSGYEVVIVDTYNHNQPFNCLWATIIRADITDYEAMLAIFKQYTFHAVMHFAGFIEVGESVIRPDTFYHNNVIATILLLDFMRAFDVKQFVFSSSCAVYGIPQFVPIDETHPFAPASPYGKTKLAIEYVLQDYSNAYGLNYVALRYFNAAGACIEQGLGEWHKPETHVIPLLLCAAAAETPFTILGSDYDTPDGTCIRDYVHVLDIADAHVKALKYLESERRSDVFNLGSGVGYSVKQLVSHVEHICAKQVKTVYEPRRQGDVPVLVANSAKAQKVLGWRAEQSSLDTILTSAWHWEQNRIQATFKHEQIFKGVHDGVE